MSLTHSTGFNNFWFIEPDQKLRIHFDPGTRYSYSGEGFSLLQFAIEHGKRSQGLGIDVGDLTNATFARLGMTRTGLMWRPDFASNLADGWNDKGEPQPHDERSNVRVAGSMDTTITDLSKFVAALVCGDGLSATSRKEMTKPQPKSPKRTNFRRWRRIFQPHSNAKAFTRALASSSLMDRKGMASSKVDITSRLRTRSCALRRASGANIILSNDVRAEAGFADLVKFILGDTGVPYDWEYGDYAGKS